MAEMTPEQLQVELDRALKELAETKDEAAKRRIELKDVSQQLQAMEPQLEKLKELEDNQKTQEELYNSKLQTLQTQITEKEEELKKTTFLAKAVSLGVPEERARYLSPDTFEGTEEEVSDRLKAFVPKAAPVEDPINPQKGKDGMSPSDWAKLSLNERLASMDKLLEEEKNQHPL